MNTATLEPSAEAVPLYAADAHRLLREIAARCEKWFFDLRVDCLGYPQQTLARRYTQKLLAEIATPFRRELKRRAAAGENWSAILTETHVDCGDFRIDPSAGASAIRTIALFRWIGIFFIYWFYVLVQACIALRLRSPPAMPAATILHGVPHENLARGGHDASFLEFTRRGPVGVLRDAQMLFVQAVRPVVATEPVCTDYARYPLLALLRRHGLTLRQFVFFVAGHLRSASAFAKAVTKTRAACILARDFAFNAAAASLNGERMLAAVVLCGSNFLEQMLWMSDLPARRYAAHMIFYSVNGNPFVYKAHPAYEHQPSLSYMRVDEFWVWTPRQAQVVREWGSNAKCHVVGPILFSRPTEASSLTHALKIVVFDITPLEPELIERLGVVNPYYTTAHVMAFLRDVLEARDAAAAKLGRAVTLVVKPKRKYQRVHSSDYIDFLLARAANDSEFRILDPDTDLADVIGSSDCVITMPYSSPPYIALELGVPSIYYDPTDALVPSHEPHPLIVFAGNPRALELAVDDALSGAVQRAARRVTAN